MIGRKKTLFRGGAAIATAVVAIVLLSIGGPGNTAAMGMEACPGAAPDKRQTLPAPAAFAEKVFEVSDDGCLNAVTTLTVERTSPSQFNVKFLIAHGDDEFVPQASASFAWFGFFGLESDVPNVITKCDFEFRNPDGSIPSSGEQNLSPIGFLDVPLAIGQGTSFTEDCTVDFDPCVVSELTLTSHFDVKKSFAAGDPQSAVTDPNAPGFDDAGSVAVLPIVKPAACSILCDGNAVTINMQLGASGVGTAGNDVILGTDDNDTITGNGGDDTICGQGGNDLITGGDGDDRLFGSAGMDIMRGGPGTDYLEGGADDDRVLGGIGNDVMSGGDGDDYLGGFGGGDTISGGSGSDTIFGGFGADVISGDGGNDEIFGLIGNDTINGGSGNDRLNGDRGNDTISGGPGNDVISGGNANDIVSGDGGDDSVSGGKADDTMSGGPGTDTCAGNKHNIADTADSTCETIFGVP